MPQLFFAQKAFIVHDRKLLLVRKSADDPNQPGLWEVPGGRMDFGEEIDEHLRREVREEVGIEVIPGVPFHVWQWSLDRSARDGTVDKWQVVAVARMCEAVSTELSASEQVEGDYLSDMAWVPFDQLNDYEFISNMLPVIESFLQTVRTRVGSR